MGLDYINIMHEPFEIPAEHREEHQSRWWHGIFELHSYDHSLALRGKYDEHWSRSHGFTFVMQDQRIQTSEKAHTKLGKKKVRDAEIALEKAIEPIIKDAPTNLGSAKKLIRIALQVACDTERISLTDDSSGLYPETMGLVRHYLKGENVVKDIKSKMALYRWHMAFTMSGKHSRCDELTHKMFGNLAFAAQTTPQIICEENMGNANQAKAKFFTDNSELAKPLDYELPKGMLPQMVGLLKENICSIAPEMIAMSCEDNKGVLLEKLVESVQGMATAVDAVDQSVLNSVNEQESEDDRKKREILAKNGIVEQDGIFYFDIVSDGTSGEEWITRLNEKGFTFNIHGERLMRSRDFHPTKGVKRKIAILKNWQFSYNSADKTFQFKVSGGDKKFVSPDAEIAPIIREKLPREVIHAMGIDSIAIMHPMEYPHGHGYNGEFLFPCLQEWTDMDFDTRSRAYTYTERDTMHAYNHGALAFDRDDIGYAFEVAGSSRIKKLYQALKIN
ncbi:MAG: hypothetical protein WCX69_03470 [Candidatus Paceibacterota bacterium]